MNSNYTQNSETEQYNRSETDGYSANAINRNNNQVISGYFPSKAHNLRAKAVKRVNSTLCCLVLCAIFISIVSYYFVVSSEIKLNDCSRKTALLNVENAELQNKLDKLKSFNNVDLTMQKNNLLHRPEKVIEATEVDADTEMVEKPQNRPVKPKVWSLGY